MDWENSVSAAVSLSLMSDNQDYKNNFSVAVFKTDISYLSTFKCSIQEAEMIYSLYLSRENSYALIFLSIPSFTDIYLYVNTHTHICT